MLVRGCCAGRSLFRKGADLTAFQFASTKLVVELGLILALLLGWQFALAEFVGGPLMIGLPALLFRRFLTRRLLEGAWSPPGSRSNSSSPRSA